MKRALDIYTIRCISFLSFYFLQIFQKVATIWMIKKESKGVLTLTEVQVVTNKENMQNWTILKGGQMIFAFQEFSFLNEETRKVAVAINNRKAYIFKQLNTHEILTYPMLLNGEKNTYYEEEIAFYDEDTQKIEFLPFAYDHLTSESFVEIIQAIQNL